MSYKERENPTDLPCYRGCAACYRCADKGRYSKCGQCSGRHDPDLKWDSEDYFDRCRCTEGILQIKLQNGRRIVAKYPGNPFAGSVKTETVGDDERDWLQYVEETREKLNDPNWDGVQFEDGSSTTDWAEKRKG